VRRKSAHVGPLRGAGPRPWRRRIRRIELAETRIPSFRSSPWMRTHPQRRFSRPRRTMRPTSSSLIGDRPGPRCFRHRRHLCLAASRCHRNSVSGVTRNDRHRVGAENVIRPRDLDERIEAAGTFDRRTRCVCSIPLSVTPVQQEAHRGGTASTIKERRPSSARRMTFSAPTGFAMGRRSGFSGLFLGTCSPLLYGHHTPASSAAALLRLLRTLREISTSTAFPALPPRRALFAEMQTATTTLNL
jgi:hypothetical protein